ncbi:hypothetical protein ES705_35026 [subsurface metagenome]
MRLIGYGRCDPMEGEKAVNEVRYISDILGLRGLKLHPRSEGWVDSIKTEKAINVLIEAAKQSLPVLFDTRGKKTIMDIGQLIKSTRQVIKSKQSNLLKHFKCIIAHFAQGNIGDYEVYNTIVQPNTYGDLSMLHGEGTSNFLESFREWFISNQKESVDNRTWSQYLLYASDYPYFGDAHAEKLLIYIINKRFFDTGGTINDVRNILGLNQLKILPEYSLPQYNMEVGILPSTIVSNPNFPQNNRSAVDISIEALAKMIVDNKMDIKRLCPHLTKLRDSFNDDILLSTSNIQKKEINLLYEMGESVQQKIDGTAQLYSQYYFFNTYTSNVNDLIAKYTQNGGNISSNLLLKEFDFNVALLFLFGYDFSIFPTIDRLYSDLKLNLNKTFAYYIYPSKENHNENELKIINHTLKQFLMSAPNNLTLLNIDFIPYLGKPTIIFGDGTSEEINVFHTKIANVMGNSVNVLTDNNLFQGGKSLENLRDLFPSDKIKIYNVILSYEFINNFNIFKKLLQTII